MFVKNLFRRFAPSDKKPDAAKTFSDSQLVQATAEKPVSKKRKKLRAKHKSQIQSTGGDSQKSHKSTADEQQRGGKKVSPEVLEAPKTETAVDKTREASSASNTPTQGKRLNTAAPRTDTPADKEKQQKPADLDVGCPASPGGSRTSSGNSPQNGESSQSRTHDDKRRVKTPSRNHGKDKQHKRPTVEPTPGCSSWRDDGEEPPEPGYSYWMSAKVYNKLYGHSNGGKDLAPKAGGCKLFYITPYSTCAHRLTSRSIRLGKLPDKMKRTPAAMSDRKKSRRKDSQCKDSQCKDSTPKSDPCRKRKKWERRSSSRPAATGKSKKRKRSLSQDRTKRTRKAEHISRRRERSKSPDKTRRARRSESTETDPDDDISSRKRERCKTPNKTRRLGRTEDDDQDSDEDVPERKRGRCRTPNKTRRLDRTEDDEQDSNDHVRKRKRKRGQSPDKTKRVRFEEGTDNGRGQGQAEYSQYRHRRRIRDPYEMVSLEKKRTKFRKAGSLGTRLLQYRTMRAALLYRQPCCDRLCCVDWEMLDMFDVVGRFL